MVRVTKIKESWFINVNKRLIGEGEQLKRLYAHSRKCQFSVVVSLFADLIFEIRFILEDKRTIYC